MFGVSGKRRESFIWMGMLFLAMQLTLPFIQQLFTISFSVPGAVLGIHHTVNKRDRIPLLRSLRLVEALNTK